MRPFTYRDKIIALVMLVVGFQSLNLFLIKIVLIPYQDLIFCKLEKTQYMRFKATLNSYHNYNLFFRNNRPFRGNER